MIQFEKKHLLVGAGNYEITKLDIKFVNPEKKRNNIQGWCWQRLEDNCLALGEGGDFYHKC